MKTRLIATALLLTVLASGCAATAGQENNRAGLLHLRSGRYSEAEQEFKLAAEANPKNAFFISNIGIAYLDRGRPHEAITYLRKAIALDDRPALFHHNLGDAYRARGQLAEAIAEYEAALSRNPVDPVHYRLIESAFDMGVVDARIQRLEDSIKGVKPSGTNSINRMFLVEQAVLYAYELQHKYDDVISRATADIDAINGVKKEEGGYVIPIITPFFFFIQSVPKREIRTEPILASLYVLRGHAYLRRAMQAEAVSDFRKSSEIYPEGLGDGNLGIAFLKGGNLKEAVFYLRKSVEAKPGWIVGRLYYAVVLRLNGEVAAADEELARATGLVGTRVDFTLPSAYEYTEAKAMVDEVWRKGAESK